MAATQTTPPPGSLYFGGNRSQEFLFTGKAVTSQPRTRTINHKIPPSPIITSYISLRWPFRPCVCFTHFPATLIDTTIQAAQTRQNSLMMRSSSLCVAIVTVTLNNVNHNPTDNENSEYNMVSIHTH
jgi:hypothetical protein